MRFPGLTGGPVPRIMSEMRSPPGSRRSRVMEVGLGDDGALVVVSAEDFFFFFLDFFLAGSSVLLLLLSLASSLSSSPSSSSFSSFLLSLRAAESVSSSCFAFSRASFLRWLLVNFLSVFPAGAGVVVGAAIAVVVVVDSLDALSSVLSSSSNFLFLVGFFNTTVSSFLPSTAPSPFLSSPPPDAFSVSLSIIPESFSSSSDRNASAYGYGTSSPIKLSTGMTTPKILILLPPTPSTDFLVDDSPTISDLNSTLQGPITSKFTNVDGINPIPPFLALR
mmetsp:Transcript_30095/g.62925  ORF Transcript_30095/g.62925 Transcript_30095/m.62925 type:complete len:278 (-) Transcript_30095:610-1443(-)